MKSVMTVFIRISTVFLLFMPISMKGQANMILMVVLPAVSPAIKNEYPEVEASCRYIPAYWQYLMVSGENRFEERTAYADFSFFDIFSFHFYLRWKG